MARVNFTEKIKRVCGQRASFICSKPDCRCLTVAPAENPNETVSIGEVAHIYAASPNGPRPPPNSDFDVSSIENAIYLCTACATIIDKNEGRDYPVELLFKWREAHENWVRDNLNKSPQSIIPRLDGEISAEGNDNVIGVDVKGPVSFEPGTKISAKGKRAVTGVKITGKGRNNECL